MKQADEYVLCFPSSLLDALGRFQGVSLDTERYLNQIISHPQCTYVRRSRAEHDARYKQLIPYVLIVCGDRIFRYKRGKRGSEDRLHSLYSVGIGGHIASEDRTIFSRDSIGYENALWREIREEVAICGPHTEACVAAINDDSNSVGAVHFGVVHVLEVNTLDVTKNHSSITDYGFVPIESVADTRDHYETWSLLCLENVSLLLARARAVWEQIGPPAAAR
jgi:predicted NUDIX family phosphoesterase